MRHRTWHPHYFFATALFLALAACSDSGTISAPDASAVTALDHGRGTNGDTALTGTPSAPTPSVPTPGDTTLTGTPFVPVTAIDLAVSVGVPAGGQDTLQSTPVANAGVTVFSRSFVAAPGNGADTLVVSETAVANGITDASGRVSFPNLPAVAYRVEAVRGDGSDRRVSSATIAPPFAHDVNILLILRP
jgi:hypothetical protein